MGRDIDWARFKSTYILNRIKYRLASLILSKVNKSSFFREVLRLYIDFKKNKVVLNNMSLKKVEVLNNMSLKKIETSTNVSLKKVEVSTTTLLRGPRSLDPKSKLFIKF